MSNVREKVDRWKNLDGPSRQKKKEALMRMISSQSNKKIAKIAIIL